MSATPINLRARAETLVAPLPPLLVRAEKLAANVILGAHGRRRAGRGDEFWQYRAAHPGDAARSIDWRRSARSDAHFVREKEWQNAQSVWLWADPGKSMSFSSDKSLPSKSDRARVLVLALAIVLVRGGEKVGLAGPEVLRPGTGEAQVSRIARALEATVSNEEYQVPDLSRVLAHGRVVLVSDFLADPGPLAAQIERNAAKGVGGALIQVLDPQEESFPFAGRTIFESMGRSVEHETLKARDLRPAYLDRLQKRRAALSDIANGAGWSFFQSRTDTPAQQALLWAYRALESR